MEFIYHRYGHDKATLVQKLNWLKLMFQGESPPMMVSSKHLRSEIKTGFSVFAIENVRKCRSKLPNSVKRTVRPFNQNC